MTTQIKPQEGEPTPLTTEPGQPAPQSISPNEPGAVDPVNDRYKDLDKEDLLKILARSEDRLHEVNNESKNRKLKLREMESAQEEASKQALLEQNKYKELYDKEVESKKDYEALKTQVDAYNEQMRTEIMELEKKVPENVRKELEILGDMTDAKKLAWLKFKLESQTGIVHDTSRSASQSGSLSSRPENRRDFFALPQEEKSIFRDKFPTEYKKALATP